MLYIYRRNSSSSARELVNGLMEAGTPARRWSLSHPRQPRPTDRVICWGDSTQAPSALNSAPLQNKYQDAVKLSEAGVATIEATLQPIYTNPYYQIREQHLTRDQAREMIRTLEAFASTKDVEWLGRKNRHVGGNDLLTPPTQPDFYVKKESIAEEYRLHIFQGKSIRAGVKRPREANAHPWIRAFDSGWSIAYDNFTSTKPMRTLAKAAVEALGLEFGAVDVAQRADGNLVVLEVNRAPGIEGGTIDAYVKAVQGWISNENPR